MLVIMMSRFDEFFLDFSFEFRNVFDWALKKLYYLKGTVALLLDIF